MIINYFPQEERQSNLSSPSTTPTLLPQQWREKSQQLQSLGIAGDAAKVFDNCAQALEAALKAAEDEPLSLHQAAARSGYSPDHLSRQVRKGVIPNAGRPGKPLIRVRDLPSRPRVANVSGTNYDPTTDARSLRVRGRRNS